MKYFDELKLSNSFSLFTKLVQKKMKGNLLSDDQLNQDEKAVINQVNFIEKKILFECPTCGKDCLTYDYQKNYICDCETEIRIEDLPEREVRYVIKKEAYDLLKETINQECEIEGKKIICQFDEKSISNLKHDDSIYLHCSPFTPNITGLFFCQDNAYLDHFFINWNEILHIINSKEKIIKKIIEYRNENIKRQIDWTKINQWDFEKLGYELIEKEKIFDKIIPGGKGTDQEKDGFGYKSIIVLSKPEKIEALIQYKYTKTNATFNKDDIRKYKDAAIEHGSNYLFFITNGYLSGITVTSINRGAYNDEKFRGIDIWNHDKLILLLEKHADIRLKYFFNSNPL